MKNFLWSLSLGMFAGQYAALAGTAIIPIEPEFAVGLGSLVGAPVGVMIGRRFRRTT